ncbi:hypothetical protein Y032_0384g412 [Ancylostoma ceylanicum]|nr:hypothetical protein Y032_0384g412 [Ancylostoma ceylanicum]
MANLRAIQEGEDILEEVRVGEDVLEEGHVDEDAREGDVFRDVPTPGFAEQHQTPSSETHESDIANLSIHDRILYYAMYAQHFGLSGEEIKRMEELMHVIYGSPPPITGVPAHDRSDVRYFQGFSQNIETSEEFQSNHLKILLSLSIDGFVPKRISRREIWPLYLRVDNIRKSETDKYVNSMLSGMLFSLVKPTDQMMEVLFSRIESEMKALQELPIMINVDGDVWTLQISLHKGIADMGAQKTLFGVPRWNSLYGCSKCYMRGQHVGHHQVWVPTEEDNISLRSPDSFLADGQIGANGIPNLFEASTRFPELRINRDSIEGIKRSLKEASCHTYSNRLILSLEDLRNCKASELDEIAFVLFPLVAAGQLVESPVAAVSLLGYWLCLRIISLTSSLTTTSVEEAQNLAKLTKELWRSLAPQIFTMKCHWFFDHAMSEEIQFCGSAYQWSSAPFESHHRRLQIRLNQSTVNSSTLIVER